MTVGKWIRILTGGFTLISIALAVLVNKWWLVWTALIGLNLIQSPFTGRCFVEKMLWKFGIRDPRKVNCALYVASELHKRFPLEEESMAVLLGCAGGKAPEECCGAFYAARRILERYAPQATEEKMKIFQSFAGSLKCEDIKALKKKTCRECIEEAIEVVEKS